MDTSRLTWMRRWRSDGGNLMIATSQLTIVRSAELQYCNRGRHVEPSIFIRRLSFKENVDCTVGHDSYGFVRSDGADHIAK